MGDIKEFIWPKHKIIFFRVTGNGINFDIKSDGPAKIGLTDHIDKEKDRLCSSIWVVIGNDENASITYCDNKTKSVIIPNILSKEEYKHFWISWADNNVVLGYNGGEKTILQYECTLPEIKYVKFEMISSRNNPPVQWRVQLPPIVEEPTQKLLSIGKLKWVQYDTRLPRDALIGGFSNETLYIIRAKHNGSLTPGIYVPSEGCGSIIWEGEIHKKTTFEVLCGIDCVWVPTRKDIIPIGAVEAGYTEVNEPLYIGRSIYKGNIIPGKVVPLHKVCCIHSGTTQIATETYEILTVPDNQRIQLLMPPPLQTPVINYYRMDPSQFYDE